MALCYTLLKGKKWPDPFKDKVVYVGNPIEANLPSHWVPLSIVKRIMEMRAQTLATKYFDGNIKRKTSRHTFKLNKKLKDARKPTFSTKFTKHPLNLKLTEKKSSSQHPLTDNSDFVMYKSTGDRYHPSTNVGKTNLCKFPSVVTNNDAPYTSKQNNKESLQSSIYNSGTSETFMSSQSFRVASTNTLEETKFDQATFLAIKTAALVYSSANTVSVASRNLTTKDLSMTSELNNFSTISLSELPTINSTSNHALSRSSTLATPINTSSTTMPTDILTKTLPKTSIPTTTSPSTISTPSSSRTIPTINPTILVTSSDTILNSSTTQSKITLPITFSESSSSRIVPMITSPKIILTTRSPLKSNLSTNTITTFVSTSSSSKIIPKTTSPQILLSTSSTKSPNTNTRPTTSSPTIVSSSRSSRIMTPLISPTSTLTTSLSSSTTTTIAASSTTLEESGDPFY